MLLPQSHCNWTTKVHGNGMVSLTSVHIRQRAQVMRLESDLLQHVWALVLKLSYRTHVLMLHHLHAGV